VNKTKETEEHTRFVVYFDYAKGGIAFGKKLHAKDIVPLPRDFAESLMNCGQLVL
jgi:hypothetical protein